MDHELTIADLRQIVRACIPEDAEWSDENIKSLEDVVVAAYMGGVKSAEARIQQLEAALQLCTNILQVS